MREPILKIAQHIKNQINALRTFVGKQNQGQLTQKRYETGKEESSDETAPEKRATSAIRGRQEKGFKGESDKQETASDEERQEQIKNALLNDGFTEDSAYQLAATLVKTNLKVVFDHGEISSPAFFDVKMKGGIIFVTLNSSHPAYSYLNEVLEEEIPYSNENQDEKIQELLNKFLYVREGLKLLLSSWARYEDESPDGILKTTIQRSRWHWGDVASSFFEN